jgi:hypothetical protein
MKMKTLIPVLFFMLIAGIANAQHVKVKIGFPVGISIGPSGRAPFSGAIWIGPEWTWRGGNYVCSPGYWARPSRHGAIWVPGHWKNSRRGFIWIPGHWR